MELEEFIDAVFVRYPPGNINTYHTLEDAYGEYRNALRPYSRCSLDKALNSIIADYEYSNAPSPHYIIGHMQKYRLLEPPKNFSIPSVYADKDGKTYEYGVLLAESTPEQVMSSLVKQGFTNVRMQK